MEGVVQGRGQSLEVSLVFKIMNHNLKSLLPFLEQRSPASAQWHSWSRPSSALLARLPGLALLVGPCPWPFLEPGCTSSCRSSRSSGLQDRSNGRVIGPVGDRAHSCSGEVRFAGRRAWCGMGLPARPPHPAALFCLFCLVLSYPGASIPLRWECMEGKMLRAQVDLAQVGSTGSSVGPTGISGQIRGSGAGVVSASTTVHQVSRWVGNRAGPRGREGSQLQISSHHGSKALSGPQCLFHRSRVGGGAGLLAFTSLLLSRRTVREKSQELLASVQVWAILHGWACLEHQALPATSSCLEGQGREVMRPGVFPKVQQAHPGPPKQAV